MDLERSMDKLRAELDKLKHELNVELPKQISEARDLGDLRENAGYHAARERMGFVKARIGQLSEQLARLNSMDMESIPVDCVGFGSRVVLIDLDTDSKMELTFVSESEMDLAQGRITLETPYGRALANKKVGQQVEVLTPAGTRKLKIKYLMTIHGNEYKADQ
ncbi:MAG: transcription elongation factor GreA [bacterium]|nr:transcription elongation factor GreA [bacterium]